MNKYHQILLLISLILLSGCSGFLKIQHYEIVKSNDLIRFQIHDWYEKEESGPSIGVFRPPVYGFKKGNQWYAIYPIYIRTESKFIGPPIVPFIPLNEESEDDVMIMKIRHFSREGTPIKPAKLKIKEPVSGVIVFKRSKSDEVGTIYTTTIPATGKEIQINAEIQFSDGSSKEILYTLRTDHMYSPFFSFNGPNPRPEFVRYPK